MPASRDDVKRRAVLDKIVPTCFHVFACKRDKTIDKQVEMDDGFFLYILAAGNGSHEAQTRANERFGGGCTTLDNLIIALQMFTSHTLEAALDSTPSEVCRGAANPVDGAHWGVIRLSVQNVGTSGTWTRFTIITPTTSSGHQEIPMLSRAHSTMLSV